MENRSDKSWMIHLEKKADDEFLMHFKGPRMVVIDIILATLCFLYWVLDMFSPLIS